MTFQLGEIEVRAAASVEQLSAVVEEEETEIEQASRDRRAVDLHMFLGQMPAPGPHQQRGNLVAKRVGFPATTVERERSANRIDEILLAFDDVEPRRGEGIFEVGHEDVRA